MPTLQNLPLYTLCLILLTTPALSDNQTSDSCSENSKLIEYGSTICELDYDECPATGQLVLTACVGYRCRFEVSGRCYYYTYQNYDSRRCLNECCGIRFGVSQAYTNSQLSTCLQLNSYASGEQVVEGTFNKLPVILGSVIGVLFFIVVAVCICCRKRIRQYWNNESEAEVQPNLPRSKKKLDEPENNNIQFILENNDQNSDHNIIYDKEIQCTICLSGDNEMQTPCGHWFHLKCFSQWIEKNLKCPNCNNQEINPVKIVCRDCHKPFVEIKLNRKNQIRSLKKSIGNCCKACNQLKLAK